MFIVQATMEVRTSDGWESSRQLETVCFDEHVNGIITAEAAINLFVALVTNIQAGMVNGNSCRIHVSAGHNSRDDYATRIVILTD